MIYPRVKKFDWGNTAIVVFDTETKQREAILMKKTKTPYGVSKIIHEFYIIGWQILQPFKSAIFVSRNIEDFLYSIEQFEKVFIFAHNMSFDFRVIWHILKNKGFRIEKIIPESSIFYVRTKMGEREQYWISTTNYFKTSLAKLGEIFGLEKLEIDYFGIGESVSDSELGKYLQRDVEILARVVDELLEFVKSFGVGINISISSIAFDIFKKKFLRFPIDNKRPLEVVHEEKKSYYGGRVEIFRRRFEEVVGLDFNSLYPFIMKEKPIPIKYVRTLTNVSKYKLLRLIEDNYMLVGYCKVQEYDWIPLFPYRENGKLYFPNGEFKTWLAMGEIEQGLKERKIVECEKVHVYKRYDYLFREFIEYFYNTRKKYKQEGNEVMSLFYKLIMNSLSGKFGQIKPIYVKISDEKLEELLQDIEYASIDLILENDRRKIVKIVDRIFELREKIPKHNFTAIISTITSYARVHLYNHLKLVEDYIYYCDTDSLYIAPEGLKHIPRNLMGNELGQLKEEIHLWNGEFVLPKTYWGKMENGKWYLKTKGIPKRAVKIGPNEWEFNHFDGLKENLRWFGFMGVSMEKRKKSIKSVYDKRETRGNITYPIHVSQLV